MRRDKYYNYIVVDDTDVWVIILNGDTVSIEDNKESAFEYAIMLKRENPYHKVVVRRVLISNFEM